MIVSSSQIELPQQEMTNVQEGFENPFRSSGSQVFTESHENTNGLLGVMDKLNDSLSNISNELRLIRANMENGVNNWANQNTPKISNQSDSILLDFNLFLKERGITIRKN